MTLESNPYAREVGQIRQTYIEKVTQLSARATSIAESPNRTTRILDGALRWLPWYKDAATRANEALSRARGRLRLLERINFLDIRSQGIGEWDAEIKLTNAEEAKDRITLRRRLIAANTHTRSGILTSPQYIGRSDSGWEQLYFDHGGQLANRYEWVINKALAQRARNHQTDQAAQRTESTSP